MKQFKCNTSTQKKQSTAIIFHSGLSVTVHRYGQPVHFYRKPSTRSIERLEKFAKSNNARWGRYWSDERWMSGMEARLWCGEPERNDDLRSYLQQ